MSSGAGELSSIPQRESLLNVTLRKLNKQMNKL